MPLSNLGAIAGLGQHHFATLFRQSTGISPYRYVINQRIDRAKYHLLQTTIGISDIALSCGFADQSHLTKHFRKIVGMTPKAFRDR